jgi:superkiller protein 3
VEIVSRNRDWKDDHAIALRTLEMYPDSSDMRSDVAMAEWRAQDHAEAIRQWRTALAYHPDNAGALSGLGFAMLEQKNYVEAIQLLQKAIGISPRYAMAHVYLGRAFLAQGKTAEAEAEFRAAVEIYPMNPLVRNALGRFYLDSRRLPEAESEFQASVGVNGNFAGWSGLAEAYTLQGSIGQAGEAWRQVLSLEPYDSQAHLNLGRIFLAEGRRTEARKEFEGCLYTDPHNAEALIAVQKLGR